MSSSAKTDHSVRSRVVAFQHARPSPETLFCSNIDKEFKRGVDVMMITQFSISLAKKSHLDWLRMVEHSSYQTRAKMDLEHRSAGWLPLGGILGKEDSCPITRSVRWV